MSGFSDAGLARLEAALRDEIARGAAPGLVAVLARGDETHIFAMGAIALTSDVPMRRDTLFRITSMTKPVTAAAMMMLVEEGRLALDEPVGRLAPELADLRVLTRIDGPLEDTVPAGRAMTIEDVMTFRLGWGVVFGEGYPIMNAVAGLPGFGMPDPRAPIDPDEWLRRLGQLPLMSQPGERWLYSTGSNVQGVLVARAAGQPLDRFVEDRLLRPLGMSDTAYWIEPESQAKATTAYACQAGKLALFDPPHGMFSSKPAFPAGDSGLVSSAEDYLRFTNFLCTGLDSDRRPLLSPASLEAMKTNHLTVDQRQDARAILGRGRGWGYGMGVVVETTPDGLRAGSYGWDGGFGTSWFTDPAAGLTAILLTQRLFDSADPPPIHKRFRRAAYAALREHHAWNVNTDRNALNSEQEARV
jgi:CubicO group peptidase (beta-lactamase class C family)